MPFRTSWTPQVGVLLVARAVELEPHAVDGIASASSSRASNAGRIVGGILPLRQRDDADLEALPQRELHAAERRLLARGVGVEAEEDALGQPRQLAQLPLGERRAHRGDDRLEARLAERDHVGVPLDDDAPGPPS